MNKLESVSFNNFRCFNDHEIHFNENSLIVGKNNAGKSTCIEGLRLLSIVTQRLGSLPLKSPPRDLGLDFGFKGVSPSLESISIQKECIFHRYGDPPAIIAGRFSNAASIEIYVGEGATIHALIKNSQGRIAKSKSATTDCEIPKIGIMPQIGPVQTDELLRTEKTVRRNLQTNLSSLHFRNQISLLRDDYFQTFCDLCEDSWHGLRIEKIERPNPLSEDQRIVLIVRDGNFSAEIAWMGHGLQMWLQTIWFLAKNRDSEILILDEPDVYMHADLQRKLMRMLLQEDRQIIVATHSAEMMSEVLPSSIIVLNRDSKKSVSATSTASVQAILTNVGSVHNLSLARIGIHKKIVLVEGKDITILKKFQNVLFPHSQTPIDTLPNTSVGGWSGWPSVLSLAKFFKNNSEGNIEIFCVFDRDYHTKSEIDERFDKACELGIKLTIWEAKELENYAILPGPIQRILSSKGLDISIDETNNLITLKSESLRENTLDAISEFIRLSNRSLGANVTNPMARKYLAEREEDIGLPMIVNGKKLLSSIVEEVQKSKKISFGINQIFEKMKEDEVHPDVCRLLRSFE